MMKSHFPQLGMKKLTAETEKYLFWNSVFLDDLVNIIIMLLSEEKFGESMF